MRFSRGVRICFVLIGTAQAEPSAPSDGPSASTAPQASESRHPEPTHPEAAPQPGASKREPTSAEDGASHPDAQGRQLQTQKGPKFVGVPIPTYNPQLEFALGLMGMVTYRLDESDPYSPPSATIAFGMLASNGSWLLAGAQELFWARDDNRATFAVAGGHFNSDYYGTGSAASAGISFPLGTDAFLVFTKYLRRVWGRLYLGGLYNLMLSGATLSAPSGAPEELDTYFPLETSETASGLGIAGEWDSRDNRFSPTRGLYIPLRSMLYAQFLGSTTDYGNFKLEANWYRALHRKDLILAARAMLQTATADTPFYLLPAVGSGPDLRGYASGRYRDYVFYATQAELRWYFWKGLGAVVFGGIGTTTSGFDRLFEGTVLPSYGLGLRYMIDDKSRLVIRTDYGRGDEDGVFYFSVSEAF